MKRVALTAGLCLLILISLQDAAQSALMQDKDKLIECKEVRTIKAHKRHVSGLAFSKDGSKLVTSGDDKTVKLWDVATGKELKVFTGHDAMADNVVITPDGALLASVSKNDGTVRIWDCQSGKEKFKLKVTPSTCLALSPDGKMLATGALGTSNITLIDINRGKEIGPLKGEKLVVWSADFSPKAPILAVAGQGASIALWDTKTKKQTGKIAVKPPAFVASLNFSPDGNTLVWGDGQKFYGWDIANNKELFHVNFYSDRLAFSPDGKYFATGGSVNISIADALTGLKKAKIKSNPDGVGTSSVAFSPDGKLLAIGTYGGTVRIIDTSSLK